MRILHTSDWHLGKSLENISRMDEQQKFLDDFIDLVNEKKVDMVIIAGDVYDTSNPPARAEKMFYNTLKNLSMNGERIILIVSGNHDNPERLAAAGPLAMDHGIIMVGTPKTIVQTGEYGKHRVVNSGEGFVEIEINKEKAVILTVPYPSESRLNEVLYGVMDDEDIKVKAYSERIHELFKSLSKNYREDTINLVVSHLFAMGSEEGGSERSIQLGGSYIVSGTCFPKEAQYVALGHVHKPQVVPNTGKKAWYSGSPLQYSRKEYKTQKKCYIVDVKPKEEAKIQEVELKTYKPIEVWECNNVDEALLKCEENSLRDCYVFLEIKTNRFIREDEIKKMKEFKKDILSINPIIQSLDSDEEESTLMSDKSFEDLFKEFYKKEKSVDPDEEIVELFLSIVGGDDNNETN
ncbi:MAG: exonuclease SbcCD subunit D [Clostridium sp.]